MSDSIKSSAPAGSTGHVLQFRSLFDSGRGLAFPCDAQGRVDLDALSDSARNNYFFARAVVGRDFTFPAVVAYH
jgi:hypothetical protein